MNLQTFVLIGRSGSGKGTQAKLLIDYIRNNDDRDVVVLETGKLFREFVKGDSYSHKLSKEIYDKGGLQPAFLSVYLWSNLFIKHVTPNVHLILDGTPRKLHETYILDSALRFYDRTMPVVMNINVSRNWSRKRLTARGREDDSKKGIEERLDWFDTEVKKCFKIFKENPNYRYLLINGEQSIEWVFEEIIDRAFGK